MTMPTALFLSPHLDDAVFSCGGLAARLAGEGWHTVLVTAFTRSVVTPASPTGKEPAAEIDEMALRRAEDLVAAECLGFDEALWLDLPEAAYRGYGSVPALFGAIRPDDPVAEPLAACLVRLNDALAPSLVLAPQGLEAHVDHRQVIAAVLQALPAERVAFYRDTPYAIHAPDAQPDPAVPRSASVAVPINTTLDRKVLAAQAYASRVGFQCQGSAHIARILRDFAVAEGGGWPAERLMGQAIPAFLLERPGGRR
jgi:LmbE family N-acetylglucosaminyl deacetylase